MQLFRFTEKGRIWQQISAVLSASLLAIISGIHMGWSSPSVPKLLANNTTLILTENEVSVVVMIGPLGFIVGSPLSGILLDKIGRKRTLLLLAIPDIITCLLIATATSSTQLYIGRFLSGVSDGGSFTCLPIYFGEILHPKLRGTFGVAHAASTLTGNLIINAYGSYTTITTASYISLTFPLIFLATFIWMPESPYFLLARKRISDARETLQQLRQMKNIESELTQLQLDVERQLSESSTLKDIFFIPTNLRAFLLVLGLRSFQQLSGVACLNIYLQTVFRHENTVLSASESALIVTAVQIVFIIASGRLLDKFGRRSLLNFSYIISALILFILGTYFYLEKRAFDLSFFLWIPVTGMVVYSIISSVGLQTIPGIMSGELLSASIKSKAVGIINMYTGLLMSGAAKMFQSLDYNFGMYASFYAFAVFSAFGTLFSFCCVPETKKKTLEEIQQDLKNLNVFCNKK